MMSMGGDVGGSLSGLILWSFKEEYKFNTNSNGVAFYNKKIMLQTQSFFKLL
jgi:hypothetical protein